MTFTGIVRGVDSLGRIVLPKKIRQTLDIKELTDPIEISVYDDMIFLKKIKENSTVSGDSRCLDNFGRIVIPIEIRNLFGIVSQVDSLEIYREDEVIILKKHMPACVFCGNEENVVTFKDKKICTECINKIKTDF